MSIWADYSALLGPMCESCWQALCTSCKIVPSRLPRAQDASEPSQSGRGEAGETATFSHSPRWGFLLYHLRDQHPMSSHSSPQGRPTRGSQGTCQVLFFPQQCINDVSLPFRPEGGFYLIQTPERRLRHPAARRGGLSNCTRRPTFMLCFRSLLLFIAHPTTHELSPLL